MGTARVIRSKAAVGGGEVVVERESLGQVTDYTVWVVKGDERKLVGSGSKREAQKLYDKTDGAS